MFEGFFGKKTEGVGQADARSEETIWAEAVAAQHTAQSLEKPAVPTEDIVEPKGISEDSISRGYEGLREPVENLADSTPSDAISPDEFISFPSEPTPAERLEAMYAQQKEFILAGNLEAADALQIEINNLNGGDAANGDFKEAA